MEKKPLTKHPETRGGINEKIIIIFRKKEDYMNHQLKRPKPKI